MSNNNSETNEQQQAGLIGGHVQYVKGVAEVGHDHVPPSR